MEQRVFYGKLTPADVARSLVSAFNRGNLRAQMMGQNDKMVVQIATREGAASGGQTALTVQIQKVEDGVLVQVGQQAWLGVAASLGQSALATLLNPVNLLNRLDDIAQDIENLQLNEKVWDEIGKAAQATGASHQLSEQLSRLKCGYCDTANPVGEPNCVACGAPLGNAQPRTCGQCGYVVKAEYKNCPNCGTKL